MTKDEFNEKSSAILEILEDRGAVSTALDEIRGAFFEEVAKRESAESTAEELKGKNEGLLKANMDLFLKVGKESAGTPEAEVVEEPEKSPEETITIDDLFDENGELK